jgi:glycosyltransferase involved in cell wall biosynthesis
MISVIMPVYNTEKFLKRSIDSILSQTEKDFEFIIVNDGSTDASEEIILSYDDPRIVYVKQENQGVAAARNKGLSIAKGEFIAWQDADDISLPIRLEIMKNSFTSDAIGFVHCDMLLVDENGTATGYWQYRNTDKTRLLRFFLKKGMPCHIGGMMMQRSALGKARFDTALETGGDADLFSRIGLEWVSVHIAIPLYVLCLHANRDSKHLRQSEKAAHVRKFLSSHSLEELVPEIDWDSGDGEDNQARACAIISLLLARRGMKIDADEWFERATSMICSPNEKLFVRALSLLQNESYELARQILRSYAAPDCIVDNYLGEIAAITGDSGGAFNYFLSALAKNPYYLDPIDNLRSLGGVKNIQLVDTTWLKYKQIS